MRGVKAKAIRREVYGDMSHRTREYAPHHHPQRWRPGTGRDFLGHITSWYRNPTCICTGLRRRYQDAKRGFTPAMAH